MKIILGVPPEGELESPRDAQIATKLRALGFYVLEINSFQVMIPELLRTEPYVAIIHTDILNLFDLANSHRATIIALSRTLAQSAYRLWDPRDQWEITPLENPGDIEVWKGLSEGQLIQKIFGPKNKLQ